jgi:hypothetical protein
MKTDLKRRAFINTCVKAGIGCCALAYGTGLAAEEYVSNNQNVKPDPKNLEYCGYKCPPDCLLKKATAENNVGLKKQAFDQFKFKEKFKVEFDPEKVFCYGCRVKDKPLSIPVKACTVRTCVIAKGYDCCIECDGLAKCDKELWTSYPKFKEAVIVLQKKYRA